MQRGTALIDDSGKEKQVFLYDTKDGCGTRVNTGYLLGLKYVSAVKAGGVFMLAK